MTAKQRQTEDDLDAVARRLASASRVLLVTGAGMSADSGMPTYRGVGGLYQDAATEEGIAIEQALSGSMMVQDPGCCWRHIMRIEKACRHAVPHQGHRVLVDWQQRFDTCLLTQNVDGLHSRAGSQDVLNIHGNIHDIRCTSCRYRARVPNYHGLPCPPHCPNCGEVLRPEVVLFGELLPAAKLGTLQQQVLKGFDVAFSIGTTSVFPYISEPILHTRMRGGLTVEINPGETSISDIVDVRLALGAKDALVALAKRL